MSLPDGLDQSELDGLVRDFTVSSPNLADAGDGRYSMQLQNRRGMTWLVITGMVMQPVPVEFTDRLQRLISGASSGAILVDVRSCTYVSSSVLGVLAMLLQVDHAVLGRPILMGASDKIRAMMRIVAIDSLFVHVRDETEAACHILLLPRRPVLAPRSQP